MFELFKGLENNTKEYTNDTIHEENMAWRNENITDAGFAKIASALNQVNCLANSFTELKEFNNQLDRLISCTSAYYWFFKENYSILRAPKNRMLLDGIKNYEFLRAKQVKLSFSFISENFEAHQNLDFDFCIPGYESFSAGKVRYFQCLYNVRRDIVESFMAADAYLLEYHLTEANESIVVLKDGTLYELNRSKQLLSQIFSNGEDGFITELIRAYVEARQTNRDAVAILDLIEYIADRYKETVAYFEEKFEENLNVNINKLNILLGSLRPNSSIRGIIETDSSEFIPDALQGSLDRILQFSNLPIDKINFFKSQLDIFKSMENKGKFDLMLPETRNRITSVYFEIYEAVFKRMIKENINDKAIDMFLVFGFMDNNLLTNQQTIALSRLLDLYTGNGTVYSMKQWLSKIYLGEKPPSINELGVDYEKAMKEKRADNRENTNDDSMDNKLDYEIMNMFKTNHKLCSGQISTYFPVLHGDMLPNDITRASVTMNKIKESLTKVLDVDFSAFHREAFYTGDNPVLKKELIMKQVMPDIILVPIAGTRAMMWQEQAGRSRLSPGRFLLPIFTSEDLNNLVTRLIGNYRWEICRAAMGAHWNDVSYKSLTSEYADYIQSYKKNKNLSQENKDKIKVQAQRYRNSLRDIFSSDYEAWIKYEAEGIRKVNKEVRAILYRYCPFKRTVREELINQPAFSGIAAPFENERKKFAKELESRYAYYVKRGHPLEPELEENLKYYKEL